LFCSKCKGGAFSPRPSLLLNNFCPYSFGAPTGQVDAHAPHSIQVSGSITYLPSFSVIAETGQADAHEPHPTHSSPILYAIE
jgi:hypothetical protein